MAGRGILIAAGGPIPLTNTYVALHMLRNVHNCSLPVQIYYNGTSEMDVGTRKFLEVRPIASDLAIFLHLLKQSACVQGSKIIKLWFVPSTHWMCE